MRRNIAVTMLCVIGVLTILLVLLSATFSVDAAPPSPGIGTPVPTYIPRPEKTPSSTPTANPLHNELCDRSDAQSLEYPIILDTSSDNQWQLAVIAYWDEEQKTFVAAWFVVPNRDEFTQEEFTLIATGSIELYGSTYVELNLSWGTIRSIAVMCQGAPFHVYDMVSPSAPAPIPTPHGTKA